MVLSKFRYLQNGFAGIVFSLIMPQHLTIFSIGCEALQVHPFYKAKTGIAVRLQVPDDIRTIHVIKTDDPVGVEAYWHNRFKEKRKKGEFFELAIT